MGNPSSLYRDLFSKENLSVEGVDDYTYSRALY